MRLLLLITLSLLSVSSLFAETSLIKLFSDGMVLQRGSEIRVWGTDKPGQELTVSLNGERAKAQAGDTGHWELQLPAMKAGGPYTMEVTGSSSKTFKDVYIGEVWLCSGQSNMEWPLKHVAMRKDNPTSARTPLLRMFKVGHASGGEFATDVNGSWQKADGNIANWSAVPFHFGNFLHQHLDVPVGLINSSKGGTPIESWTRHAVLDQQQEISGHVGYLNRQIKQGKMPPDAGWRPAGLYNKMIAPIAGYTIKGCIWYQGESNAGRAQFYATTFKNMITDWRQQWGIGDFSFITVQLANHQKKGNWAGLREAQNASLALPNTGIAVAIDIGESNNIHPANKRDVGHRLFLNARKLAYDEDLVYSGPMFSKADIEGDSIRISFDHVADGLKVKGDTLTAWEIAGADKQFVSAKAVIDGTDVLVSSDQITEPEFVRYGWASDPQCNLYNSADLPASPFRTKL